MHVIGVLLRDRVVGERSHLFAGVDSGRPVYGCASLNLLLPEPPQTRYVVEHFETDGFQSLFAARVERAYA